MYQTLFYIPAELFGRPVFGFGLLLAVWTAASVALLGWLLWRRGPDSETLSYVPLLALVAAIIWFVLPALAVEIPGRGGARGLPIRGYGVMVLLAVVAATALLAWRARRAGLSADLAVSMAFWMCLPGVVGARLFYVAEYWETFTSIAEKKNVAAAAVALVNLAEGGLVIYGGIVGGAVGLLVFAWRQRLPVLATFDLIAPSMFLGLALGRIGCLLNGCCFGGPAELPWAVTFPRGTPPYEAQAARGVLFGFRLTGDDRRPPVVRRVRPGSPADRAGLRPGDSLVRVAGRPVETSRAVQWLLLDSVKQRVPIRVETAGGARLRIAPADVARRSLPVHPTQLYSAVNALLLCLLLLAVDPWRRHDGTLVALGLSVYAVARFLLEILRTDEPPIGPTGLTISQNVSLLVLACAAGLWWYVVRRRPGRRLG